MDLSLLALELGAAPRLSGSGLGAKGPKSGSPADENSLFGHRTFSKTGERTRRAVLGNGRRGTTFRAEGHRYLIRGRRSGARRGKSIEGVCTVRPLGGDADPPLRAAPRRDLNARSGNLASAAVPARVETPRKLSLAARTSAAGSLLGALAGAARWPSSRRGGSLVWIQVGSCPPHALACTAAQRSAPNFSLHPAAVAHSPLIIEICIQITQT